MFLHQTRRVATRSAVLLRRTGSVTRLVVAGRVTLSRGCNCACLPVCLCGWLIATSW